MSDFELAALIDALMARISADARSSQRNVGWDDINGPRDQALDAVANTFEYISGKSVVEDFRAILLARAAFDETTP